MNYHFFDYKYNIQNFSSDLFSTPHIIFIILTFVLVPIVSILLKNTNHKKIEIFLKIFSILVLILEITKITWESYYDITTGRGFNVGGILPLYTCSIFIYALLLSAYGKGKFKKYSISFLTTISLLSGAIGVVQCNGLNYYPFWTFGAFYSLFFHFSMFAVGVFLLISKFKILEWNDIVRAWIPMTILSIVVNPLNYEYGADYMQLYEGSGIPLLSSLAQTLANLRLRFLFTIIMLFTYMAFAGVVVCFAKLIYSIENRKMRKEKLNASLAKNVNTIKK